MNTSKLVSFIALSLVALCSCALTATAQAPDTTTLRAVVISATKTPTPRSTLTQAVTVLSGEELRARGLTRVADALRSVPGASLVQNGSTGSVATLFLRGGESRYTKVLIDGVAVNSPGGFFDFSHLTTDNIERIEIVRGPASVAYGADAVAGVIQIFTRQGRGPLSITADARGGSHSTLDAGVEASGASSRSRFSLGAGHHKTDGILPFNNQYYNGTLSGSAGFTTSPGSDAVVNARYTMAEYHYPTDFTGAPVDSNSYRVQHRLTGGFEGTAKLGDSVKAKLLLGANEVSDLTEDIAKPFGANTLVHSALMARTYRHSAEGRLLFALPGAGTLNVGAEYMQERGRSVNSSGAVGGPTSPKSAFAADRNNKAVYAELLARSDAASYTISGRRDDNSDYKAFNTYRVGASTPLGSSIRIRSAVSTAYNAPAFEQLRPTLYTAGSPDLKPERSRAFEVGIEQELASGAAHFAASYFNQTFTDLIQYVAGGPPTYLGSYANLTEARTRGYEGELSMTPVNGWSGSASYTIANPRVTKISSVYTGGLKVGDALVRRPTHTGNAVVSYSSPTSASFSVQASYIGKRPDYDFNQFPSPVVTLPAYVKLDVAGSLAIFHTATGSSALSITGRVDNALDKKYEDVLHYASPRRTFLIGARLTGSL
ncbi:MAG TPA: TonB-dependent receptor [Gemmatimonadaceae bacterium]|nr:TonB-dependent receptor [Gemmatimonadaceae bacterium]